MPERDVTDGYREIPDADWMATPEAQERAFELLDRLTFSAEDCHSEIRLDPALDARDTAWEATGTWVEHGYIADRRLPES